MKIITKTCLFFLTIIALLSQIIFLLEIINFILFLLPINHSQFLLNDLPIRCTRGIPYPFSLMIILGTLGYLISLFFLTNAVRRIFQTMIKQVYFENATMKDFGKIVIYFASFIFFDTICIIIRYFQFQNKNPFSYTDIIRRFSYELFILGILYIIYIIFKEGSLLKKLNDQII